MLLNRDCSDELTESLILSFCAIAVVSTLLLVANSVEANSADALAAFIVRPPAVSALIK